MSVVHPSVIRRVRTAILSAFNLPPDADHLTIQFSPVSEHVCWACAAVNAIAACRTDSDSIAILIEELVGYMHHPSAYDTTQLEISARQACEHLRIGSGRPSDSDRMRAVLLTAIEHYDDMLSSRSFRSALSDIDMTDGLQLLSDMRAAISKAEGGAE